MDSFDTVVLSSGGSKGYAQLGALNRYALGNTLANANEWVGVSIGSIISLLMVCGYNAMDIYSLDMRVFKEWLFSVKISDVQMTHGLLKVSVIRDFLAGLLLPKLPSGTTHNITFKELNKITNKTLIVVSCELHDVASNVCIHDHVHTPDEPVIDAVIASCSIPFLSERFEIGGVTHVDGGFGYPFPIDTVDDGKKRVLGIYTESINDISTSVGYISATIDIFKHVEFKRQCKIASDKVTIIQIQCDDINLLDEYNYIKAKSELFIKGWDCAHKYISST